MRRIIIAITGTICLLIVLVIPMIFNKNISLIKRRTKINSVSFVLNDEFTHKKNILEAKKNKKDISYFIKKSEKGFYGKDNENYYFIITPRGKMIGYSPDGDVNAMTVKYLARDKWNREVWVTKNYPPRSGELKR